MVTHLFVSRAEFITHGQVLVLERSLASSGGTAGEQQIRSQVWTFDTASGGLNLIAANAFNPRWVP